LIEALAAKDGIKAEAIVRGHIQITLKIMLDALGNQDRELSP
jgi:DNA-binding GntR family transcriptional regulator